MASKESSRATMMMMIRRASLVSGSISRNVLKQTPIVEKGRLSESALSCRKRFLHTSFAPLVRPFRTSLSTVTSNQSPVPVWRERASATCYRSMQTTPRLKLSPRQAADLEDRLWKTVASKVQDDVLKKDLLSLQWWTRRIAVSDDGTIQILLKLPSLLHPTLQELKDTVKLEAENEINLWLKESGREEPARVNVEAIASPPMPMMARLVENPEDLVKELGPGLANVSHFVAVYSCKGGVGKSTVAVNLAYELAHMGGRVGLLDVDLYGPSLPVLIKPTDVAIRTSPLGKGMVYPIVHEGVKVLSMGYVATKSGVPGSGQENGPAIMRGPMAGKVVAQMLKGTDWGELDVLVLDLPPGTGDVQLAVCQDIQLSGAVAISTPSKLATVDTRKGIDMFTSLGVPTLAVVENMAYFVCEGGTKHYPFGRGMSDPSTVKGGNRAGHTGRVVQLPISTTTNDANDAGEPICLMRSEAAHVELSAFSTLAKNVSKELLKLQYGRSDNPEVVTFGTDSQTYDVSTTQLSLDKKTTGDGLMIRLFSDSGATQERIMGAELRSRDPKTGDKLESSPFKDEVESTNKDPMVTESRAAAKKSPSLTPKRVDKKGRYGYAVHWDDGAIIIYSVLSIARAAGGVQK